jgi:hypothetical protein
MKTITFRASAKFGFGGKQYIARITGRDAKFTFERSFIDRKEGKRREDSTAIVDEPGLYMCVDVDKHGKDETFTLVWRGPDDELYTIHESTEEAMLIAKRLDAGEDPSDIGREEQLEILHKLNFVDEAKAVEEVEFKPNAATAALGNLPAGKYPRARVIAARMCAMARLVGYRQEIAAPEPSVLGSRTEEVLAEARANEESTVPQVVPIRVGELATGYSARELAHALVLRLRADGAPVPDAVTEIALARGAL